LNAIINVSGGDDRPALREGVLIEEFVNHTVRTNDTKIDRQCSRDYFIGSRKSTDSTTSKG